MSEQLLVKKMPNGMVLLGHPMAHVSSVAMTIRVPAGAAHDPQGLEGAAAVGAEWSLRGAGQRDTRQLNEALDNLGCRHTESAGSEFMTFGVAVLTRHLSEALEIYADIIRRPHLSDAGFEPCRELTIQDLASLEDHPAHKATILLRQRFLPYPLGRCLYGTEQSLGAMTAEGVRRYLRSRFSPRAIIVAVAGHVDWPEFCEKMDRLFGDWSNDEPLAPTLRPPEGGIQHLPKDSAQTHITLAHKSVAATDPWYYSAQVAAGVLSGGTSSRLFIEVREKRGLAYHVSTSYGGVKSHCGFFTYAGTVPQKAQETLEVVVQELRRVGKGIEPEELRRARTQLKSSLIMSSDSTVVRSARMANQWYELGRLRSLAEIHQDIDRVTIDSVLAYLQDYPAQGFAGVVIGPEPLDIAAIEET